MRNVNSPPKCIINIADFLGRARSYDLTKQDRLLVDAQEFEKAVKRTVSVFVSAKFGGRQANTQNLSLLGVKPQRVIKDKGSYW